MSNRLRLILVGAGLGLVLICCAAGILFVIWTNQPENTARFDATDTAVAVKNAQGAATAEAQAVDARLKDAQPVFTETFEADSTFLKTKARQQFAQPPARGAGGQPAAFLRERRLDG